MKDLDKIIGGLVTVASASMGAYAIAAQPCPLWVTVTLAGLGALGGLVKIGWFGTGSGTKTEVN